MNFTFRIIFIASILTAVCVTSTAPSSAQVRRRNQVVKPPAVSTGVGSVVIGARTIMLPAPDGFAEGTSRVPLLKEIFERIEPPNSDLLAAHVQTSVLREFQQGAFSDLAFYTKVSTLKATKELDITAADFARIVSAFERQSTEVLDLNSLRMQSALKNMNSGVSDLTGGELKVDISQPVNLGQFEKTPNVYSFMLAMKLREETAAGRSEVPLICASSFVHVNRKIIYTYAYKRFKADADVRELQMFSKSWTNKIVAANRN